MSNRPESGFYLIFTAQGNNMCLGLDTTTSPRRLVLQKYVPDAIPVLTWAMWPIPGSNMFYLQHFATGDCSRFESSDDQQVPVRALDPDDTEFVLGVDDVGDGNCAIKNHDLRRVFDCKEASNQEGTPIIGHKWNEGSNQKWRFVVVDALDGGSTVGNDTP